MRIRQNDVLNWAITIDATVFVIGSFAANLIDSSSLYIPVAIIVGITYGFVRWLLFRRERIAMLATQTLSDELAVSAETYGVTNVYNMQRRLDQDRRNLDTQVVIKTANWMRLTANSGASYLSVGANRHWPDILARLKDNVPFDVILLDPFSEERGLRNDLNIKGETSDSKLPLGDIIRACNQFPRLQVAFAKNGMTCTAFITNEVAFFDPYHLAVEGGRITNLFMCLRIKKIQPPEGISNYDIISRHFDAQWKSSVKIREWLEINKSKISNMPKIE